jgi:hypothetical protein
MNPIRLLRPGDTVIINLDTGDRIETYVTQISITEITLANGWHISENPSGYYIVELVGVNNYSIEFEAGSHEPITNAYELGDIIHVTGTHTSYRVPITQITETEVSGGNTVVIFTNGAPQLKIGQAEVIITKKEGLSEVAHLLYSKLDPTSLVRLTQTTSTISDISDPVVWKANVERDFPEFAQYKPASITYYQQYQDLKIRKREGIYEYSFFDSVPDDLMNKIMKYVREDRLDLLIISNALILLRISDKLADLVINDVIQNNRFRMFEEMLDYGLDDDNLENVIHKAIQFYETRPKFLQALLDLQSEDKTHQILDIMIRNNKFDLALNIARSHTDILTQHLANVAVANGAIPLLDLMATLKIFPTPESMTLSYLNFPGIEWCIQHNIYPDVSLITNLSENDDMDSLALLVNLYEKYDLSFPESWMPDVWWSCFDEFAEYILDHFPQFQKMQRLSDIALLRGSVSLLQIMYDRGGLVPSTTSLTSAVHRKLQSTNYGDVIKAIIWAIQHGTIPDITILPKLDDEILFELQELNYNWDMSYFDELYKTLTSTKNHYAIGQLDKLRRMGIWK